MAARALGPPPLHALAATRQAPRCPPAAAAPPTHGYRRGAAVLSGRRGRHTLSSIQLMHAVRGGNLQVEPNMLHSPKPLMSTRRGCVASPTIANVDDCTEGEGALGYTMTQICDKFIEFFMYKKPQTKDWRKVLVFREEWERYRPYFYKHCQARIDMENDSSMKQKLVVLARKVKKIDNEIEKHMELFTQLRENPTDINAIVARRRKDFTGGFFQHLNFLVNAYNGLDERDAIARLGAKCLSAIHAYDCTLEQLDLDSAQSKFDDILNSSSLDDACDKIKSLAKTKELDSSLILLINRAWAAAKDSTTMKNEVKDIMCHIYTTTKESLKSISPPEMKLLKYLLNIEDPEERFGALATAFSPEVEHEAKDEDALYTTPNELHKWTKMMLDSYHLNKEETDFMDARKMSDPVIIQRLTLLKETIEEEYMKKYIHPEEQESEDDEDSEE
ncbi:endoribonuclease E-like protein [Oryza sativa Japonica Group]|uniref:Endoribonuclease E-like protein n=2 Tax=Oryza sativa subsp. japonica TaxID=39947 RepID=Q657T5_ORYSJ|nr:uncharacterized protein At4g37920 [Oryza sativa Japonica Group]KAB8081132.1 hypothetical protein EE612_002044 [Oryza sativa]KAF2949816.1 hypothetical protein DAI22_01g140500 [Oryza sativa Japonica Group]BAD44932.1 endoribonuclease E-like protein [Oryza sativa Japonica Group]BAD45322.1 endoribonuclease E-like protein [Oryza sativa Japonica Group]BAF04760.1 Os01g0306800 [Oryza sativa Japonica Group]|eukprot:NP_001042846.1 Os01g0306800 [Oryza sativa Japonica Group]